MHISYERTIIIDGTDATTKRERERGRERERNGVIRVK